MSGREAEPAVPVVLRSGGPVMSLESVGPDGTAVCRWTRWDDGDRVTVNEWGAFPLATLYRCEDFRP